MKLAAVHFQQSRMKKWDFFFQTNLGQFQVEYLKYVYIL